MESGNSIWQRWQTPFWLALAAGGPIVFSLAWWFLVLQYEEQEPNPITAGPKLGVVLVFDQLRGDYLVKWERHFCEGGFKRLQREGAWFPNCHYPYAGTLTAAGHASLLTGCSPRDHGIIANEWFDRSLGKPVAATDTDKGPGAARRRRPTIGDLLLELSRRSKMVSLSIKERSAIMMAALRAQLCYWFNNSTGHFETSRNYPQAQPWVDSFNARGPARSMLKEPWSRLATGLPYKLEDDDVEAEGKGYEQGRIFPHPTPSYKALETSPFGNDLLLAFAKEAIEKEQLGRRGVTDLLCVSFSSNDLIGHAYGPDSYEVLDVTLRSDLLLQDFLQYLDDKIGKGNYVVALSADHGICPLPPVAKSQGVDAKYVDPSQLISRASNWLQEHYGKANGKENWFEYTKNHWIYLNQKTLKSLKLNAQEVAMALAGWFAKDSDVQAAFTRAEVSGEAALTDPVAEQVRQSFHPECSGDVAIVLKPYRLLMRPDAPYTTTHGTPHAYDTHVPLLAMGPGIRPGTYEQRIAPQALATIMARALNMPTPKTARYFPPEEIFVAP